MCLVSKEMNLLELLVLDMTQAVRLVPAVREDVERDLAADGVRESVVGELFLQGLDERSADACLLLGVSG